MEALECFFCGEGHRTTIMSLKIKKMFAFGIIYSTMKNMKQGLTKKKSLKEGGSLLFGCCGLGLEIAPPLK